MEHLYFGRMSMVLIAFLGPCLHQSVLFCRTHGGYGSCLMSWGWFWGRNFCHCGLFCVRIWIYLVSCCGALFAGMVYYGGDIFWMDLGGVLILRSRWGCVFETICLLDVDCVPGVSIFWSCGCVMIRLCIWIFGHCLSCGWMMDLLSWMSSIYMRPLVVWGYRRGTMRSSLVTVLFFWICEVLWICVVFFLVSCFGLVVGAPQGVFGVCVWWVVSCLLCRLWCWGVLSLVDLWLLRLFFVGWVLFLVLGCCRQTQCALTHPLVLGCVGICICCLLYSFHRQRICIWWASFCLASGRAFVYWLVSALSLSFSWASLAIALMIFVALVMSCWFPVMVKVLMLLSVSVVLISTPYMFLIFLILSPPIPSLWGWLLCPRFSLLFPCVHFVVCRSFPFLRSF